MNYDQSIDKTGQFCNTELTVTTSILDALWNTVEELGINADTLCQNALGKAVADFSGVARFPEAQFIQLLTTAMMLTKRPDFGLILGTHTRFGSYSALGYATMSCPNLAAAFDLIPRFEQVVLDSGQTYIEHGDVVRLVWQRKHQLPCPPVLVDMFFASWLNLARWMTGKPLLPDGVELQRPILENKPAYLAFFNAPIRLSSSVNALVFHSDELLQRRILEADTQVNAIMVERLERVLEARRQTPLVQKLTRIMHRRLPLGDVSVTCYADQLHMSERTLRRRLSAEKTTFKETLVRVRKALACHYLVDSELGVLEIALLLGYAENSSFTVAFKGWMGVSPSEYREHKRSASQD